MASVYIFAAQFSTVLVFIVMIYLAITRPPSVRAFFNGGRSRLLIILPFSLASVLMALSLVPAEWMASVRFDPIAGNVPIEHFFSKERVVANFVVTVAGLIMVLISIPKRFSMKLVSQVTLPIAALGIAASFISLYMTRMGWCCEHPFAIHTGFPFSWAYGIIGFDPVVAKAFKPISLSILLTRGSGLEWYPDVGRSLMNLLFWFNIGFLCACFPAGIQAFILRKRGNGKKAGNLSF